MDKTGPKCRSARISHGIKSKSAWRTASRTNARAHGLNVSADAVGRHSTNHFSPALKTAILAAQAPTSIDLEALQASEQEGLLSQLMHQRARRLGALGRHYAMDGDA